MADELRKCACHLDSGRSGATDRKRQHHPPLLRVRDPLRLLDAAQDPVAQRKAFIQQLQAECMPRQRRIAEEVALAAGRQNQVVVRQVAAIGLQDPVIQVDAGYFGLPEPNSGERPDQLADRPRDLARIEECRSHLVEQRREEVVVVAVARQDVHWRLLQGPGAGEAAESGPCDQPPRAAQSGVPAKSKISWGIHLAGGFRKRPPPLCRRLAILSRASAPPVASSSDLGSFCFFLITGSNRSPSFSTRLSTLSESNTSFVGSPAFKQRSTSSHDTGVETVGRDRARSQ